MKPRLCDEESGKSKSMALHVFLRLNRPPLFGPSHSTLAVGVLLHILEGAEDRPQLTQKAAVVAVVEVTEKRLDRLSSLIGLVKGNTREQVVNDVLLNDAVEQVLANETELAVNRGKGTLDEGPSLLGVVRDLGMVVMEVGDGDKPVVDPEVGDGVEEHDGGDVKDLSGFVQGGESDGQTDIRDGDKDGLTGTENGTGGAEVADAEPTTKTVYFVLQATLAGGGIEEEVCLPSEELVDDQVNELGDGRILEELMEIDAAEQGLAGGLGLRRGDESHVLLHVASEAVVTVVRELPREVGHQEEGVKDPTDAVVELGVLGEGTVTALVAEDPDTSADETLDEAVDHPSRETEDGVLDGGDVGERGPDEAGNHGEVAEDIVERGHERGLKAMSRNGVPDGLDVRKRGLVALLGLLDHGGGRGTLTCRHCSWTVCRLFAGGTMQPELSEIYFLYCSQSI